MSQILTTIVQFLIGYFKSFVLSWAVLPTVGALLFISTAFDIPFQVSLIESLYFMQGTFDGGDVMKVFGIFSLLLYIIVEILKLCGLRIKKSFWRGVALISIIFVSTIALVLFPTDSLNMTGGKSGFIITFLVFFFVALLAYMVWYAISKLKFKTIESEQILNK